MKVGSGSQSSLEPFGGTCRALTGISRKPVQCMHIVFLLWQNFTIKGKNYSFNFLPTLVCSMPSSIPSLTTQDFLCGGS